MYKCNKCSVDLIAEENWSAGMVKTKTYLCRTCNSEKGKLHYAANAAKSLEVRRKRLSDKEAAAKDSEAKKTYYAKNRDKWKDYNKQSSKRTRISTVLRSQRMLSWMRVRAARKGYEFDLDREWIQEKLDAGICEVTGLEFVFSAELVCRFNPYCPSIDRIDSTKGYTKSNCRAVVWIYNMAKAEWSDEVVMTFAKALASKII